MVLEDCMFHSTTLPRFYKVIKPKVDGARNLHIELEGHNLDFFVMTSSTSATLGTPGQSNYAAGNAYLDALATHRQRRGLPATSLILPMILGVGYVAEHPEVETALRRKGVYCIDEHELLEAFEVAMTPPGAGRPDHIIVGLESTRLAKSLNHADTTDAFWAEDLRFQSLIASSKVASQGIGGGSAKGSLLAHIESAVSTEAAVSLVVATLIERLARLLMIEVDGIEADAGSVAQYGLDSMIGAEFRNWIFREFAVDVPFQQLLGSKLTITKLAEILCEKCAHKKIGNNA